MKRFWDFNGRIAYLSVGGLGAFLICFLYIRLDSWIPEVQFQTAYGVSGFFSCAFGPLSGVLVGMLGHGFSDLLQFQGFYWHWILGTAISALITGCSYLHMDVEKEKLTIKQLLIFNGFQVLGQFVGFGLVAPVLDTLLDETPMLVNLQEGVFAAVTNSVATAVIGTLLLVIYNYYKVRFADLEMK